MCHYVSWKEIKTTGGETQILFLTADDVFNTKRGRELQKYTTKDDFIGHGAIDFYYNLNGKGTNVECTDFSKSANFPKEIVTAIKGGQFAGLVVIPKGILRASLEADYEKKLASLDADYKKKRASLYADYEKKLAPLDADYEKKLASLYADYKKKRASLEADYKKKRASLEAEQWLLVCDKKNRSKAWK